MYPAKFLLVEDESVIALDLQRQLEDQGHEVFLAATAAEALEICTLYQPGLALLNFHRISSADGMALARTLRSIYPLKIGFVTGARPAELMGSPDFEELYPVLYKPFTRTQWNEFLMACGLL